MGTTLKSEKCCLTAIFFPLAAHCHTWVFKKYKGVEGLTHLRHIKSKEQEWGSGMILKIYIQQNSFVFVYSSMSFDKYTA